MRRRIILSYYKMVYFRTGGGRAPLREYLDDIQDLRMLVLPHAYRKKTQKIPQRDLKTARRRSRAFLGGI